MVVEVGFLVEKEEEEGVEVGVIAVVVKMVEEMEERKVVEMVVERVEEVERVAGQGGTTQFLGMGCCSWLEMKEERKK